MDNSEIKDYRVDGFDYIECSKCGNYSWRKGVGTSPNRRRKYYENEKGQAWRGKRCPDCSRKDHTSYMKTRRASNAQQDKSLQK